mmetsp:Transcript_50205/g.99839  ORF Transcript_50205/g.99839 Transcript_50205/m.99839 type:complete len:89 (+) Transcript_50205:422-688(+)
MLIMSQKDGTFCMPSSSKQIAVPQTAHQNRVSVSMEEVAARSIACAQELSLVCAFCQPEHPSLEDPPGVDEVGLLKDYPRHPSSGGAS